MNNKPHFLTQFGGSANWEKYDAAIKLHKNVVALKNKTFNLTKRRKIKWLF